MIDDCHHGVAVLPGEFVSLALYDDVYQRAHENGVARPPVRPRFDSLLLLSVEP